MHSYIYFNSLIVEMSLYFFFNLVGNIQTPHLTFHLYYPNNPEALTIDIHILKLRD